MRIPVHPTASGPGDDPPIDARPTSIHDILSPWTILFLAFGCLILNQVVAAVTTTAGYQRAGLGLAAMLGVVAPVLTVFRHLGLSWRRELGFRRVQARHLLLTLAAAAAAVPPSYALAALGTRFFPPHMEELWVYSGLVPHDARTWIGGCAVVVVLAPLAEEILFRGLVLQVLLRRLPAPPAVLISALLFGAMHLSMWMLLPIAFLGSVLGLLAWATRGIPAAWIAHGLFNLVAFVELGLTQDVESTYVQVWSARPAVYGTASAVLLAVCVAWVRWARPSRDMAAADDATRGWG